MEHHSSIPAGSSSHMTGTGTELSGPKQRHPTHCPRPCASARLSCPSLQPQGSPGSGPRLVSALQWVWGLAGLALTGRLLVPRPPPITPTTYPLCAVCPSTASHPWSLSYL